MLDLITGMTTSAYEEIKRPAIKTKRVGENRTTVPPIDITRDNDDNVDNDIYKHTDYGELCYYILDIYIYSLLNMR